MRNIPLKPSQPRIGPSRIEEEGSIATKSRSITLALISVLWISGGVVSAQSGSVIPEGGVGHARQASCVILKRMGPADEVTSHLYSFGIRGKQFQFVEGKLPDGFPFHGRLTDHDVRNLQGRGAEVLILEPHYTAEDLKEARGQCTGMTGTNPNQVSESKSESANDAQKAPAPSASSGATPQYAPDRAPQSAPSSQASLNVDSTPSGADIEVDGAFVGNTPSAVLVSMGTHEVVVKKKGFALWNRKLNVTGGTVNINAELEQKAGE